MDGFLARVLSIIFLWGLAPSLVAQEGTLKGEVRLPNGEPVVDAEVTLIHTTLWTRTDSSGSYRIEGVEQGSYSLQVFAYGYRPERKRVRIDSTVHRVDLELDTTSKELRTVEISATPEDASPQHLRAIDGMGVYAAKKSEVVDPEESGADRSSDKARQLFSSVPGVVAHEEGAGGVQMEIGSRGLDPSRSAHFNVRQNGYDISADALGYPEAYYTPPSLAVERIEVVRGAASLQYGPQFGGMVNFELRGPTEKEGIRAQSQQTLGSFNSFNSYVEIGGRKGGSAFQTFFERRSGDGWRPNSEYRRRTGYFEFTQRLGPDTELGLEYTHMSLLRNQPGGLTDKAFQEDPTRSLRERNWFRVRWNSGALRFRHRFGKDARIESRFFGLLGSRDAVGVLRRIDRADHGEERLLLKDRYRNFGNETRFLQQYQIDGRESALLLGARYYQGNTFRRQGQGSANKGPDFSYLEGRQLASDFRFPSRNLAFFAENVFRVGERWTITPGFRFEHVRTASNGWYRREYRDLADNLLQQRRISEKRSNERSFLLYGIGIGFDPAPSVELYANLSTNYRGIGFNDMRLVNPNFRVDPQLKDESGYTADLGLRGKLFDHLITDISFFTLYYSDRIGAILEVDSSTFQTYRLRTNIADSRNIGVESYLELELAELLQEDATLELRPFLNLTRQEAVYIASEEAAFEGKSVEMAPEWNLIAGLKGAYEGFEWRYQYQYVSHQYADATNARSVPSAELGLVPAYWVSDVSIGYSMDHLGVRLGVHNLFGHRYFTHRAVGYSGPGIVPAPPRNYYISFSFSL